MNQKDEQQLISDMYDFDLYEWQKYQVMNIVLRADSFSEVFRDMLEIIRVGGDLDTFNRKISDLQDQLREVQFSSNTVREDLDQMDSESRQLKIHAAKVAKDVVERSDSLRDELALLQQKADDLEKMLDK